MPQPLPSEVPDSENWKFIQRFPGIEGELIPLARNLVEYDGQDYEPNKASILDFLGGDDAERSARWSDLWITIIHTLGLAYIASPPDTRLHTTQLAFYLANEPNSVDAFFMYWALRFQFPFAQLKHREWKEQGKFVQPYVFMLEHLVALVERAVLLRMPPLEHSYLTFDEVVNVLMKSRFDNIDVVRINANLIAERRQAQFDYATIRQVGYDTVEENFAKRARHYFERPGIIAYDIPNGRIVLNDWTRVFRAMTFLAFRQEQIKVTDEPTRVAYYEAAFNRLDPPPGRLLCEVEAVTIPNDVDGTELMRYR